MSGESRDLTPGPVAALILAAGGASRMGRSKARLAWGRASLLHHVTEVALASACARTFVVVGDEAEAIRGDLEGLDVSLVEHAGWRDGMGSSIAAGVAAIERQRPHGASPAQWGGVLLMLCDQPFVTIPLLDALLELRTQSRKPMVACRYQGTLGPPAYFDRSLFSRLRTLEGDRGAKPLLLEHPEQVASLAFPAGELDVDTPDDYALARERLHDDHGEPFGRLEEDDEREDEGEDAAQLD